MRLAVPVLRGFLILFGGAASVVGVGVVDVLHEDVTAGRRREAEIHLCALFRHFEDGVEDVGRVLPHLFGRRDSAVVVLEVGDLPPRFRGRLVFLVADRRPPLVLLLGRAGFADAVADGVPGRDVEAASGDAVPHVEAVGKLLDRQFTAETEERHNEFLAGFQQDLLFAASGDDAVMSLVLHQIFQGLMDDGDLLFDFGDRRRDECLARNGGRRDDRAAVVGAEFFIRHVLFLLRFRWYIRSGHARAGFPEYGFRLRS